jgi:ATP-binding cassette subfamily F protein uup
VVAVSLDSVATVLLGLDGAGGATFFADVAQWQESRSKPERSTQTRGGRSSGTARPRRRGLTYLEKRELAGMEEAILAAEADLEAAQEMLSDPTVASHAERAHEAFLAHQRAQERVDELYRRWAELEEKERGE